MDKFLHRNYLPVSAPIEEIRLYLKIDDITKFETYGSFSDGAIRHKKSGSILKKEDVFRYFDREDIPGLELYLELNKGI